MQRIEPPGGLPKDAKETWTCPYCDQTVRLCAYGCRTSLFEKCLLHDRMVDDVCIAYLKPDKARELMKARLAGGEDKRTDA
jgi:hypothetical protein